MMIFDAHADILTDIYDEIKKGNTNPFVERHLNYYLDSGITHSIFVNWTNPFSKDRSDFYDCFDVAINYIKAHKEIFSICYTLSDVKKAVDRQTLGVFLGIEGVQHLDSPEDIERLYQMGIRHASLTWNEQNSYATGLSNTETGLTDKGKAVIEKMVQLGMIIDLAHANEKTFKDIFELVQTPIVVTHGNAKALCNNKRNYTDEQLHMIKDRNGVIGVCAVASFVSDDKENQTVEFLAKHIDYIVKTIGIDHVGIGLDVCYYLYKDRKSTDVKGLETIAEAKNLLGELEKLGYSKTEIEKIAHNNFDRVLNQILK
jgi:membrane dipeptidase